MTIERGERTVTDTIYITPLSGILGILFRRQNVVTGILLTPDKDHSVNDSVILEISPGRTKLLVGPEINFDPDVRGHDITWRL